VNPAVSDGPDLLATVNLTTFIKTTQFILEHSHVILTVTATQWFQVAEACISII